MAPDPWTETKWKRQIERWISGRACPWCAGKDLCVEDKKAISVAEGSTDFVVTTPTPPRAEVWCRDCGYVMSFVVP